jgi:uncharacterized protein
MDFNNPLDGLFYFHDEHLFASFGLRHFYHSLTFGKKFMKDIQQLDWNKISADLHGKGYSHVGSVLSKTECARISDLYNIDPMFRSVINMQRYRFGQGEYKYFKYPLPPLIQTLRETFYTPLSSIANEWMERLEMPLRFPSKHEDLLKSCNSKGQERPTPLILRYEKGGFNTLHQDLYGEVYFPFQVVCVLTQPGTDHQGGEFVLTEQVPRAQSKAIVLAPDQGDIVIFTTNFRPVKGTRAFYRAAMKHGVSEVTNGIRYSLGIIFHDAA